MKYLNLIIFLFTIQFNCTSQTDSIFLNGNKYKLVFNDEFETEIDTSKWDYRTDSKHWSTQLKTNVTVNNGFLFLNVKKEKSLDKEYTGAGIISKQRFEYGYYETRLKIPKGAGWHTSFWLMNHNRSGGTNTQDATIEIDILENDSKDHNGYHIAFHKYVGGHKSMFGQYVPTPNLNEHFVTVSCEYTPNYVKYFINGEEVKRFDCSNIEKGPLNIWLTTIASHLGGTVKVDETELPNSAIFDFVRFYKKVDK